MMSMSNYSKNDIILVRYPFSDLSSSKVRPAIIVSPKYQSQDLFIVPLTSKISPLLPGEFLISDCAAVGLNVPTAVKRGLYTVHQSLIIVGIGKLTEPDTEQLVRSLEGWLGLCNQPVIEADNS